MKNKMLAVLALVVVSTAAVAGAYALGPGFANEDTRKALSDRDYEAFIAALPDTRDVFTKERFEAMAEQFALMESVKQAIEAGDYQGWLQAQTELEKSRSITAVITEENFPTFAAMHQAMKDGDFETARELAEELGLSGRFMRGHHGMMLGHMGR